MTQTYDEFLRAKVLSMPDMGITVTDDEINPLLKPHQRAIVKWALKRGRAAIFAAFGLGKTIMQLEILRLLMKHLGGRCLIVAPLGVRFEFMQDAEKLGITLVFVQSIEECSETGIYITNYETVRERKLDPREFSAVSLDEAACFPPDTLIQTPYAYVRLDSLSIGDNILNASGTDSIRDIFRTPISFAAQINVDGKSIISSDNHPYLTTRGWVAASELRPGDTLVETAAAMRILRSDNPTSFLPGSTEALLQSVLLSELDGEATADHGEDASDKDCSASHQCESCSEVAAASDLRMVRGEVFSEVRHSNEAEILRKPVFGKMADEPTGTQGNDCDGLPNSRGSQQENRRSESLLAEEYATKRGSEGNATQPRAQRVSIINREDESVIKRQDVPREGRQWKDNSSAGEIITGFGRSTDGICYRNSIGANTIPITSELLQSGPCATIADDCDRSGWQYPQAEEVEVSRSTQDIRSKCSRVDSVEILESGDSRLDKYRDADGVVYFYDLTATRHPSFSVEGFLVHNCLRGFGGTKTFRQMMGYFEGSGKYRFVATATPSPNDFIELLAYSAFLDVMDVSGAKTRFFQRNSEHADELTLMPHREQDFWLSCSTWAVFLQKPSDLGYDDTGYDMPPVKVNWIEIPSNHENAGMEPNGQGRLLRDSAIGIGSAAKEKRDSLKRRVDAMQGIVEKVDKSLYGFDQFIVWCDLNDEQRAVDKALQSLGCSFSSLYGNQKIEDREPLMAAWRRKETAGFVSKPSMYGAGCNLQQCAHAIFLGVGYKFFDFIQAIHRIVRFLQTRPVCIDIIYTEAEREIRRSLEKKWEQHKKLVANTTEIIKKFGLGSNAMMEHAGRKMNIDRQETVSEDWAIINNDSIPETESMPENSVDLILTSIPFSQQYEYSPNYRDLGHNEDNEHFWAQMDFLIPHLLRILKPGRVAAIHVKDRITPSGLTGRGYQTTYRFSDKCGDRFEGHGFGFLNRKTIVTDVVRENNQTYRLGWTEQCKDGSRMGAGMPEYLMLFRKNPTDTSNGYADDPVIKSKADYTRSRWQIDAHGFMRSNGNRQIVPSDLVGIPHERIFKLFRQDSMRQVYDFEKHVELSESLETCQECGHIHIGDKKCGQCECKIAGSRLPATFMLLQPQSWHDDVWTDVARMRTLNCNQVAGNREMHVCPLQFDICDRVITQFSMKGELVFDPFAGLGTVPMRAVMLGRRGLGVELSPDYYRDSLFYMREAERKLATPSLFDLLDSEEIPTSVEEPAAMEF